MTASDRHLREAQTLLGDLSSPEAADRLDAIQHDLRTLAAALAAAELRGKRAMRAEACAQCDRVAKRERAAGDAIGISADRNAVHDGAWFCAAELRDIFEAIDPASVNVPEEP